MAIDQYKDPPQQPPTYPQDDTVADYFIISYYTFCTMAFPLFILIAAFYCWARTRFWHCCCYYDVESALESHPQPRFLLPCLPAEPPRWERAAPPRERLLEIAASCEECAICATAVDGGEGCCTLPLCGHRFHRVCVYVWLHRQPTCPVCRRFYPFPVRSRLNLLARKERDNLRSGV